MKLLSAIELFLGRYRPTTRQSYAYPLHDLAGWIGPNRPVDLIKPTELEQYLQAVESRPGVNSPATVNKYIKTLRTFFNWLVKMKELPESPAAPIPKKKEPIRVDRSRAMTDDELAHLLDYVKWTPRHHAMILFLADTGCRVGGIAGLKVQDIQFYEDRPGGRASVTEKGDKTRWVFFQAATAKVLRTWLLRRHADPDSSYVFSPDGREIQAHSLSQSFRRLCIASGIRSLGPHSLRHRKGFQIADSGKSTAAGATLMGHDRVETLTRSYFPRDYESAEKLASELAVSDADEVKIIKLGDFRKAK